VKIGILADIHLDLNGPWRDGIIEGLCRAAERRGVEVMVIPGDVSSSFELTLRSLEAIQERSGLRCLFVPGNHDIWNQSHPEMDAWQTYEALKAFPGNLANGPLSLEGGWTAVGDLGWYDYSFGSRGHAGEEFGRMQYGERIWQDRLYAPWGGPAPEIHGFFYRKLEGQLRALRGGKILLVTHVLPRAEFTVQNPGPMWGYLNAFLGSAAYGELALAYGVRYALCGHVHYRRRVKVEATAFICSCLGYTSEWKGSGGPLEEVAAALTVVELDGDGEQSPPEAGPGCPSPWPYPR